MYEIDIVGQKRIKGVMKQFDHEYMSIVDNLRIMGDALVLLNPIKNPVQASPQMIKNNNTQSKSMQISQDGQDEARIE